MGSIRTVENLAKPVKLSVSTLQLPSSRLNIGAQQYTTSALTLNTAVTGVGGVDATVAAGKLYTVYAVVSSNVVYLIASLSSSLPTGFTQARAVGGFTTNASSQVDQVASQAGDLSVSSISVLGNNLTAYPTFRNRLINGCFRVWQRGTSFNPITTTAQSGVYTADRWKASLDSADGNIFLTRAAFAAGQTEVPGNPQYYITMAAQAFGTGTRLRFEQRIEDVTSFANDMVTISFYAKVTTAGSINLSYTQNFGTGGSASVTGVISSSVPVTASWSKIVISASIPSVLGKTIGANNYLAIELNLPLAMGNYNYLILSSVQIESGPAATPFEFRPLGAEIGLCQRYFEKSFPMDVAPANGANATSFATGPAVCYAFPIVTWAGTGTSSGVAPFKVVKRAIPMAVRYGNSSGQWAYLLSGSLPTSQSALTFVNNLGIFPGNNSAYVTDTFLTAENNITQSTLFNVIGHWTADAEL